MLWLALLCKGPIAANAAPVMPDDATLEAMGVVIGAITIERRNVFDLDEPTQDRVAYRLANAAHVRSSEALIEGQLLFKPGDRFSRRLADETERLLRSNDYVFDAAVTVANYSPGVVDVLVVTRDVWTLTASVSARRSGGRNQSSLAVKEENLLGTGIAVELARRRDVDRSSTLLTLSDNNILGSRYRGDLIFSRSSDGGARGLSFGLPYYSLDSPRTFGLQWHDDEHIEPIWERGNVVDRYTHRSQLAEIIVGRSSGLHDGWVRRVNTGLALERRTFARPASSTLLTELPADQNYVYPFVSVEWLEDHFEKATNLTQIKRTEDLHLGTRAALRLGYSSSFFGHADPAWLTQASWSTGFGSSASRALLLDVQLDGAWHDGTARNVLLESSATGYLRQSPRHVFVASLSAAAGLNLDPHRQLPLGGDSGLRGYPLRYQNADRRVLLNLEQRLFTDWEPLSLFSVGAVAFVDAGRAWSSEVSQQASPGWLFDAGVGLRLGNLRSSSGRMIHIDLAVPLNGDSQIDGVQFLLGTSKKF
jgi:hypothetical protein